MGGETVPQSYPYSYQVSLQVRETLTSSLSTDYTHNCGGAIINTSYVLTAAHCVENYAVEDLSILAGTNQLIDGGGERYSVSKITVHPNYKQLITSDIAILKINGTFNFSPTIGPIKYSKIKVDEGVNCTVTGNI